MVQRVTTTPEALVLISRLKTLHGPLMFHQSGGCCDGSSPMCYRVGEFLVGESDVKLGEIGGCSFYMSRAQFEYWRHTQLTIDVVIGRGGMFSVEGPLGVRFHTRSRLFSDAEMEALEREAPADPGNRAPARAVAQPYGRTAPGSDGPADG